MKLFFGENLSFKLVSLLKSEYPESVHVRDLGFQGVTDNRIWNYRKENGFIIVTKDTDFRERSFMKGSPPKIIWLDVGNSSTKDIVELIRNELQRIYRFEKQQETSLLILSIGLNSV